MLLKILSLIFVCIAYSARISPTKEPDQLLGRIHSVILESEELNRRSKDGLIAAISIKKVQKLDIDNDHYILYRRHGYDHTLNL